MPNLEVKNQTKWTSSWLSSLLIVLTTLFGLIFFLFIAHRYDRHLPWSVIVIGSCLAILSGALIYYNKMARQKNHELSVMVYNLKKEMAERDRAENIKQKLEIALLQGQKLQSIGTLASGIAHDFNNILYAISGYAILIKEDIKEDTQEYQNLNKIIDASHRGRDLISRILTFSRKQVPAHETINLKNTIEAALSLLKPTVPSSVLIETNLTELYIQGNQTQIHQVLVNLINNAVDAMHDEGPIKINLSKIEKNNKHFCQLDILDSGHGMDQTMLDRIFEPFYTTKEVGKGSGLGALYCPQHY